MPDFNNLPLILAGPIVRRVEPELVSIWVALSQARTIELGLWTGPVTADSDTGVFGNSTAEHTSTTNSIRIGDKLHLAVAVLDLSADPLPPGQFFSYNLVFDPGTSEQDLNSLGLLTDTTAGDHPHLALGYLPNTLPSFTIAPPGLDQLNLVHASCRKAHGIGSAGLSALDEMIRTSLLDVAGRPHQLFLTGDQIYADDVASVLLPELTDAGNALIGSSERLDLRVQPGGVTGAEIDASAPNFPATWRQELIAQAANFSSGEAMNHVLSFAEYCALYLFSWANVIWPDSLKKKGQIFTESGKSADVITADPPVLPAHLLAIYQKDPDKYGEFRDEYKGYFADEVANAKKFRQALPKVRRALANVPTYMIFDDHDATDDWYLTQGWRDRVLTTSLGVNVLRNAMLSYALFQGWGNEPQKFSQEPNYALLLALAQQIFPSGSAGPDRQAADQLDDLFGFDGGDPPLQWHYTVPSGPAQTVVLDTRTRRTFPGGLNDPPGLVSADAMNDQLPPSLVPSAGAQVLMVISAAPVLGVALIEELLQPILSRVRADFVHAVKAVMNNQRPEITGYMEFDLEAWSMEPVSFEALLEKLQPMRKVVILSGDVHYAFSAEMDYWKRGVSTPTRIVQLTSSASKNEWPVNTYGQKIAKRVLSTEKGQQMMHQAFYPLERLAWENAIDLVGEVNVPGGLIPGTFRALLSHSPVLLPTEGWPDGTTIDLPPDWSWRLRLVKDGRPDDDSPGARPADGQDNAIIPDIDPDDPGDGYTAVLLRHAKALSKKIARSVVFSSNIGMVSFSGSGDTLKVKHALMYEHPEGAKSGDPKAYTAYELGLAPSTADPPSIKAPP